MSFRRLVSGLAALAGCALLSACAPAEETGPVVLAAASLQEAMEATADAWAEEGHARPVLSFAGTSALARQAESGAPADIFFSADEQWMDWLEERDLVHADSRRAVVGNSLVFIANETSDLAEAPLGDAVAQGEGRLAIADPEAVPAGRYAKAALQAAGMWDALSGRIVPAENVRAALALVERGEAEFGVVYSSDAFASGRVVAEPLPLPEDIRIVYPAALLTTSSHADAEAFLDFLTGEEAATIFCAHGFTMPASRPQC